MSGPDVQASGGAFDRATAVTALDGGGEYVPPGGAVLGVMRRFDARVAEGWDVLGNAHGGYLMAIAARAMEAASGRPDPITISAHYLSRGGVGPALVTTRLLRSSRRFATLDATVRMGDGPVIAVLGTFGDLDPGEGSVPEGSAPEGAAPAGPELIDGAPPVLPPPDECFTFVPTGEALPPNLAGRVEMRLHPDDAGFTRGEPTGQAAIRGWFRLRDDEPMTTNALLCALDAFPPTIFNANLPMGWTPTVELTVHVRRRPAPGWIACGFRTRFVSGGFLEADGEAWDESGRLVAQSRQLALVPRG